MTGNPIESYKEHSFYKLAVQHFQEGEWEAGLQEIDLLIEEFPLEKQLRNLKQDFQLRAKFDHDEKEDRKRERWRGIGRFALRAVAAILLLSLIVFGVSAFSSTLQEQIDTARENIEREVRTIELSAKMRDAEVLLRADRPQEALELLNEIAANEPDFPGLQNAIDEANRSSDLNLRYADAKSLMQAKDYSGAQTILEEISAVDPNFKDVNLLLEDIEERLLLDGLYAKSEAHFIDEDWESAASGYESLRALKPTYNQDVVEQRLYTSYVNAARAALSEDAGSLDALQIAEEYFRKALALSPQNPEVKAERELALLYLDAQSKFGEGRWGDVITELELVVAKDSDYAAGTARQTLYEAYVARGDSRMEGGEHDSALRDYQRAVVLAEQDPEAVLRLYEALLKAGNAQGAQSNYEAAVLHYSSGVDLIDLKARAREENPTQASLLETAEAYANAGNFSVAYERYRNALGIVPGIYCISFGLDNDNNENLFVGQSMRKHIVEEGEYLTQLANQYQSTVCAIVLANKLSDPNVIYRGQELLIPVLP